MNKFAERLARLVERGAEVLGGVERHLQAIDRLLQRRWNLDQRLDLRDVELDRGDLRLLDQVSVSNTVISTESSMS